MKFLKTGFQLFYKQKNPGLSGTPLQFFQDLFGARECLNIYRSALIHNIQSSRLQKF